MLILVILRICFSLLVKLLNWWRPVSYSVIKKKQFSSAVSECNIDVEFCKVGLHCMSRGGVTHVVRAGASHKVVQKATRVKSKSMVAYYATLKG